MSTDIITTITLLVGAFALGAITQQLVDRYKRTFIVTVSNNADDYNTITITNRRAIVEQYTVDGLDEAIVEAIISKCKSARHDILIDWRL